MSKELSLQETGAMLLAAEKIVLYMGAQHNFFCRQKHSACFLQAKLLTHALLPLLQAFLPA